MSLAAHRDIELVEEVDARFHFMYALTNRLDLKRVIEYQSVEGHIVGFKSPRDSHRIKEIAAAVPRVKVLWITRDVYQVVSSMLVPLASDRTSWAVQHAHDEVTKYLYEGKYDPIVSRQCNWAESRLNARLRVVGLACLCWIAKRRCQLEAVAALRDSIYCVQYADLVSSPKETLAGVLRFLGAAWDPNVLSHSNILSGARPGGASTIRPIDTLSVNKWRSELSSADIDLIDALVLEYESARLST